MVFPKVLLLRKSHHLLQTKCTHLILMLLYQSKYYYNLHSANLETRLLPRYTLLHRIPIGFYMDSSRCNAGFGETIATRRWCSSLVPSSLTGNHSLLFPEIVRDDQCKGQGNTVNIDYDWSSASNCRWFGGGLIMAKWGHTTTILASLITGNFCSPRIMSARHPYLRVGPPLVWGRPFVTSAPWYASEGSARVRQQLTINSPINGPIKCELTVWY